MQTVIENVTAASHVIQQAVAPVFLLTGRLLSLIHILYPSSHYVTPRETTIKAMEKIKQELRSRVDFYIKENKLVEAQRIEPVSYTHLDVYKRQAFKKSILLCVSLLVVCNTLVQLFTDLTFFFTAK